MTDPVDGIIIVDKATGFTSASVVAALRRLLNERRVGHTGTLDPLATGVLPICYGRATAAATFMLNWNKRYLCDIELGTATTTMDREGDVSESATDPMTWKRFLDSNDEEALGILSSTVSSLTEETCQKAPMYSAVKFKGKPLYKYAREGKDIERAQREITVYESRFLKINQGERGYPIVTVEFLVSPGTYIRVLADQLGRQLDCLGHVSKLRRLASGHFSVADAVRIDDLFELFGSLEKDPVKLRIELAERGVLLPVRQAFIGWPRMELTKKEAIDLAHGKTIAPAVERVVVAEPLTALLAPPPGNEWLAFVYNDKLVAVGKATQDVCRVQRVFTTPEDLLRE
ncbi:MAG: tRNA pseudouridine(55) synthase TruB [Clostridiaceae bacterium]|jgi:tRNA pseudouridine55 synthase|nr:tRNA pseudouridine(55) synthase TruB [Clostridiaceae bacterium]